MSDSNKELEEKIGINRSFRLMQIYTTAVQSASGNKFTLRKLPSVEERFRKSALAEGYDLETINFYLDFVR